MILGIGEIFSSIAAFGSFLQRNWVAGVIGTALALIIGIVVLIKVGSFNVILTLGLVLLLGVGGMFVSNIFTKPVDAETVDPYITDGTVYINPDSYLDYMISYSGGLYRDSIKAIEADPLTPVAPDVYSDIKVIEYNDCVIFAADKTRDDNVSHMNVVFRKSNTGLDFVGCINVQGAVNVWWFQYTTTIIDTFNNASSATNIYNLSNLLNTAQNPYYYTMYWEPYAKSFCKIEWYDLGGAIYCNANQEYIHGLAQVYTKTILDDYFTNFDGIALTPIENQLYLKTINDFYTTIFNMSKLAESSQCVIDWTPYSAQIIDEDFYKSNRFLNVTFSQYSKNAFDVNENAEFANNQVTYDVIGVTDTEAEPINYAINIVLTADVISGWNNLNLSNNPINITVSSEDITRTITILNLPETGSITYMTSMPIGTVNLRINSAFVQFKRNNNNVNNLTFVVEKGVNNLALSYSYTSGTIATKFILNPISNFDLSEFDITQQPVTITLTHETHSVQYVFNTVEELENGIEQIIEATSYTFTIESAGLFFSQTSGLITVDNEHNVFLLNFDYNPATEYQITTISHSTAQNTNGRLPQINVQVKNDFFGDIFQNDDLTIKLFGRDGSSQTFTTANTFTNDLNLTGNSYWQFYLNNFSYSLNSYEGFQFIFNTTDGLIYTRISNITQLTGFQTYTLGIQSI